MTVMHLDQPGVLFKVFDLCPNMSDIIITLKVSTMFRFFSMCKLLHQLNWECAYKCIPHYSQAHDNESTGVRVVYWPSTNHAIVHHTVSIAPIRMLQYYNSTYPLVPAVEAFPIPHNCDCIPEHLYGTMQYCTHASSVHV